MPDNREHFADESLQPVISDNGAPQTLATYRLPSCIATVDFVANIRPGMVELLTAFECARSLDHDVWDFAVTIARLRNAGLWDNELRWLTLTNYAQHAREVTKPQDNHRRFRRMGKLSFAERTCFVLTELGAAFARAVLGFPNSEPAKSTQRVVPVWDPQRRELRMAGEVVKRFRRPAQNQERILAAFEEEGWPHRIDDPIPPQPAGDQHRRLHDAINSLNDRRQSKLIRFRGDGTGRGVVWELVDGRGHRRRLGDEDSGT